MANVIQPWKYKIMKMVKRVNRLVSEYPFRGNKSQETSCERDLRVDVRLKLLLENHASRIIRNFDSFQNYPQVPGQ